LINQFPTASLIVHYPIYAEGFDNYSMIFVLEDDIDTEELLSLLSDQSGTSYLLRRDSFTCPLLNQNN